jgi:hypothetical protein
MKANLTQPPLAVHAATAALHSDSVLCRSEPAQAVEPRARCGHPRLLPTRQTARDRRKSNQEESHPQIQNQNHVLTKLKSKPNEGFVSSRSIGGFSTKRECSKHTYEAYKDMIKVEIVLLQLDSRITR